MTKEIRLTQGKVALVDDDDYSRINQWKWHYGSGGYAVRRSSRRLGKRRNIFMHRVILNPPDGMFTDHINRNKLDNRKSNLRICTNSQNQANSMAGHNSISGHRGVTWNTAYKKWKVTIGYLGKYIFLGYYEDLDKAIDIHRTKYEELFGEFAVLGERK